MGYLLGRMETLLAAVRGQTNSAPQGFFAKTAGPGRQTAAQTTPTARIEIDERKVVTDIKTDTFNKTQNIQLGKQVVAADDINASVNKLAQLKRSE